jgi:4-hydroxy-tetrahydrodipicolinate reductase
LIQKYLTMIHLFILVLCILSSDSFTIKSNTIHRIGSITTIQIQMASDDNDIPYVMVNGMPGPMAVAAAEACLRKGLKLAPVAMTGPDIASQILTVSDSVTGTSSDVRLVPSSDTDEIVACIAGQKEAVGEKNLLAIDFTHPSAVNANAKFYVKHNIPFVMGTTGGDREQLMTDVAEHFCVVAPNMAKQIVALQAALEDLAKKYPGAFSGYSLDVIESHQKTKADTSGTAKALVDSLKVLADTPQYTYDDIRLVRGDTESLNFGVPSSAINGHAFHTYTLSSPDNTTHFVLQHNVQGRTIYAEGTADAVKFLSQKIKTNIPPRVFNMIDVLEAGAM